MRVVEIFIDLMLSSRWNMAVAHQGIIVKVEMTTFAGSS